MKMKQTLTFKKQELKIIAVKEKAAKVKQKGVGRRVMVEQHLQQDLPPVVGHQEVGIKHLLQPSLQVCLGGSRVAASTTPSLHWPLL